MIRCDGVDGPCTSVTVRYCGRCRSICGRPLRRKSFVQRLAPLGCIHVFGLFAQHCMAAGPDEVRRPAR